MRVSDGHVAALWAYLAGDIDSYERLIGALQQRDDVDGFAVMTSTAFVQAVRRRFDSSSVSGDVVRFVASARARWGDDADQIDPRRAELLVRTALGHQPPDNLDDGVKAAQIHLLAALIADEQLDDAGLETVLTRAREQTKPISD